MPEHVMDSNAVRPVCLEPFDHQVGGHHSMWRYNEETLCKPFIPREQLFYETLPDGLKEFTPQYRGMIEARLIEDSDGYIKLMGYPLEKTSSRLNSSSPTSSGSDSETSCDASLSSNHMRDKSKSSIKLLRSGSIEVSTRTERTYYMPDDKSHNKASINPWSLKLHKEQVARMRKERQDSDHCKFILLENVAAHFKHPCILDLKMGPRQHGDDATAEKIEVQTKKCAATTSASLGLRLCGMQVYQQTTGIYSIRDKFFGRSLMAENFKDSLYQFLNTGYAVRTCVVKPIVQRLEKLYSELLKQPTYRFYSSSLLIMYEGNEEEAAAAQCSKENDNGDKEGKQGTGWTRSKATNSTFVEIKMIDFAHATRQGFCDDDIIHKGPDTGYLFGLRNLITFFKEIGNSYGTEDWS